MSAQDRLKTKLSNPDIGEEGIMVAIWPPAHYAEQVALPGAEPPDKLHITLAFLGTLDDLTEQGYDPSIATGWVALEKAVVSTAVLHGPFEVRLRGTGMFPSDDSDQQAMAALVARSTSINETRLDLLAELKAEGVEYTEGWKGPWRAHMTLDYLKPGEEPVPVDTNWGNFLAEYLVISYGPRKVAFPLGEAS